MYELCCAIRVPTGPVFAYKFNVNAMLNVDEERRVGVKKNVFLRVAVADHCVMVTMHFLGRT